MIEIILLVIAAVCALIEALWSFQRGPHFGWLAMLFLVLALIAGAVGGGSGLTKRSDVPYPFNRATIEFNDVSETRWPFARTVKACAEITPDTRVVMKQVNGPGR